MHVNPSTHTRAHAHTHAHTHFAVRFGDSVPHAPGSANARIVSPLAREVTCTRLPMSVRLPAFLPPCMRVCVRSQACAPLLFGRTASERLFLLGICTFWVVHGTQVVTAGNTDVPSPLAPSQQTLLQP